MFAKFEPRYVEMHSKKIWDIIIPNLALDQADIILATGESF